MSNQIFSLQQPPISDKIRQALAILYEARVYARDTSSDQWDYSVGMKSMKKLGLNLNDLRWLIKKGYVEHAREVSLKGSELRQYRPLVGLSFTKRTCFVMSDPGVDFFQSLADPPSPVQDDGIPQRGTSNRLNGQGSELPFWNAELRELRVNGTMIRAFKWQAINQELVLSAFQEDGWPFVIDDPLPPKEEQDPRRRLHDTIKALNRNQSRIRFHGNGTGEGIRWELLPCDPKDS